MKTLLRGKPSTARTDILIFVLCVHKQARFKQIIMLINKHLTPKALMLDFQVSGDL